MVKDFSDGIGSDINKCDFGYYIMKCFKIWKICVIQWANIFNDKCMLKIMHRWKIIQNAS